jgi:hypothetical protein
MPEALSKIPNAKFTCSKTYIKQPAQAEEYVGSPSNELKVTVKSAK